MHLSVSSLVRIALLLAVAASIMYGLNFLYQQFTPSAAISPEEEIELTREDQQNIVDSLQSQEPVTPEVIEERYEILEALDASRTGPDGSVESSSAEPSEAEIQAKLKILEALQASE